MCMFVKFLFINLKHILKAPKELSHMKKERNHMELIEEKHVQSSFDIVQLLNPDCTNLTRKGLHWWKKIYKSSSAIELTFWQLYSILSSSQSLTFLNCSYFVDKLLLYYPSQETTYFTTLCLGTTQKCHQTATLLAQKDWPRSKVLHLHKSIQPWIHVCQWGFWSEVNKAQ